MFAHKYDRINTQLKIEANRIVPLYESMFLRNLTNVFLFITFCFIFLLYSRILRRYVNARKDS